MRLLSRVYQVVFLQVGELSEALVARLAFERSFPTVHPEVDLQRSHSTLAWLPRQAVRANVRAPGLRAFRMQTSEDKHHGEVLEQIKADVGFRTLLCLS